MPDRPTAERGHLPASIFERNRVLRRRNHPKTSENLIFCELRNFNSETSSLVTLPSSEESANFRSLSGGHIGLRIALCDRVRHARYGLHLIPPRELVELPPAPATASKPRPVNTSDQLLQRLDAVDENRPFSRSIRPWRCQFIRLTMHERVRREIAAQSLERSQMVVLDALLKLRQVCCDPRLVSLAAMRKGLSGSRGEASASRWPEVAVPHVQGNPIADSCCG